MFHNITALEIFKYSKENIFAELSFSVLTKAGNTKDQARSPHGHSRLFQTKLNHPATSLDHRIDHASSPKDQSRSPYRSCKITPNL